MMTFIDSDICVNSAKLDKVIYMEVTYFEEGMDPESHFQNNPNYVNPEESPKVEENNDNNIDRPDEANNERLNQGNYDKNGNQDDESPIPNLVGAGNNNGTNNDGKINDGKIKEDINNEDINKDINVNIVVLGNNNKVFDKNIVNNAAGNSNNLGAPKSSSPSPNLETRVKIVLLILVM